MIVISSFVATLLGEGVLRITMKEHINLFPRFHDSVTYGEFTIRRYRPEIEFWHTSTDGRWRFEINNMGFRDSDDYQYEKQEGVVRILALGDSHTSGYEVRQEFSFPELIEKILRQQNVKAESLNAGISGFSTAEQLVYLENEGIKYDPDFVIVGVYANDFEDNIKAGLFGLENGALSVRKRTHTPGIRVHQIVGGLGILRWLSQHSYLYSFGFNTAYELAKKMLLSKEQAKMQTEVAVATMEIVENYEEDLMRALISRMLKFCKSNGTILIFVDIPRVARPDQPIRSSIPESMFNDFQSSSDFFLYSPEVLSEFADRPSELHVPHGHRHISEAAHAAIAQAVSEVILNNRSRGGQAH
jgi:lysophospholipase L1-like esterase